MDPFIIYQTVVKRIIFEFNMYLIKRWSNKIKNGNQETRLTLINLGTGMAYRYGFEKKGCDTDITLTPIISTTSTNASSFVLNLIQQGAGSWNRVGRKTHLKSVTVQGFVNFTITPTAATGVLNSTFVRLVLVWDKQPAAPTGAIPTFDAIFGITAQDGTESCPDITCPPRYDTMDRFRVIRDWYVTPPPTAFSGTGTAPQLQYAMPFKEYIKLGGLESVYSGQSAPMTIADINSGALYLYARTLNNNTIAVATLDGICRLRYVDQ